MLNDQEQLFTDTEVIDLCNSVINIHRSLITLFQYFGDLESLTSSSSNGSENVFVILGLRTLAERFLTHQNVKLTKIMEIYKTETKRLIQQTEGV